MAAALLHDVVEDTDTDVGEIRRPFGSEVADLVAAMTEELAGFERRGEETHAQRLEYFRATLTTLSSAYPSLPLLAELRAELDHVG